MTDFFKCFYNEFPDEAIVWFAYHDDNHDFENPVKFQLDNWIDDDYATKSLKEVIAPRILPANFTLDEVSPVTSSTIHYQSHSNLDLAKCRSTHSLPIKHKQGTLSRASSPTVA